MRRFPYPSSGCCLAALILAVAISGCATIPVRTSRISKEGKNVLYKRYAKFIAVDYFHRFSNTAYRPSTGSDFEFRLTPDQEALLEDLGQPDLVRCPFKSTGSELVTEWVYVGYHHLAQFIEGQLAYEGPMTDYEKLLMEFGYPDVVSELSMHGDLRWVQWVYKKSRQSDLKVLTLAGDKLIQEQTMR